MRIDKRKSSLIQNCLRVSEFNHNKKNQKTIISYIW